MALEITSRRADALGDEKDGAAATSPAQGFIATQHTDGDFERMRSACESLADAVVRCGMLTRRLAQAEAANEHGSTGAVTERVVVSELDSILAPVRTPCTSLCPERYRALSLSLQVWAQRVWDCVVWLRCGAAHMWRHEPLRATQYVPAGPGAREPGPVTGGGRAAADAASRSNEHALCYTSVVSFDPMDRRSRTGDADASGGSSGHRGHAACRS